MRPAPQDGMPTPAISRILTTRTVRSLLFRRRPQPVSSSGETRSPLSHRTRLARCARPCPRCGARMIVIEVFARGSEPRWRPTPSTIRHIMSNTVRQRRRFPVPLRWPHAGGDLSRRNHANQRADRSLIRSTPPPRSLLRASRPRSPPCPGRRAPASRPPSNPHSAGRPHGAPNLPRLRALALFGRPAAGASGASRDAGVQKPAQ